MPDSNGPGRNKATSAIISSKQSGDLLRRAMGKKKVEEMAQQRAIFTKGAIENGIDEKIATYVFDLMEKFAGYGFNKSTLI
jgi:DNA polymerase-3 subunit alpha